MSSENYTHHKSLTRYFWRLVLDENALARIATIIAAAVQKSGNTIEIEIVSANEQDTIRTSDPQFFTSAHMPLLIHSVSMEYHRYNTPVSLSLRLVTYPNSQAKLSVDGTDRNIVLGVFSEIEKELDFRKVLGGKVIQGISELNSFSAFLMYLLGSWATAASIYSIFDLPLRLASSQIPNFKGSPLNIVISTIGWICVFFAMLFAIPFREIILRTFPVVEFSGRLGDPYTKARKRFFSVVLVILLPIILNVLAGLLTKLVSP